MPYTTDAIQPSARELGFDSFVCNSKNEFPLNALKNIAMAEPGNMGGAVLLVGKTCTGKTHLLNAVAEQLISKYPETTILGDALEFCSGQDMSSSKYFWKNHNILLLDDLQACINKSYATGTQAQDILTNLLDNRPKNSLIILAFSGLSEDLRRFVPRLFTRLENCLALNLLPADLDVRMRYIQHHTKKEKLAIDDGTLVYMARHCQNIRAINGLLLKITAFKSIYPQTITRLDLDNLLHTGHSRAVPEYRAIMNRVARNFNVQPEDILGNKRLPNLVLARQVSMYVCRKSLGLSYPELGRAFGGKDHSTVIYAIKKIQKMIDSNKDMYNLVTEMENSATY